MKSPLCKFWFLIILMLVPVVLQAQNSILVISSYNPESYNTTNCITSFIDEFSRVGGDARISIENMNCMSFSQAGEWTDKLNSIFSKYSGNPPSLIILLGQEAWCSYLSMSGHLLADVPVFCGMASCNIINLSKDILKEESETRNYRSLDVFRDFGETNLSGGYLYYYDFDENIRMIRQFYPKIRHIAFLTDNTCGGVSLQAYVRKSIDIYPDLDLIPLDGSVMTVNDIMQKISELPEDCVILLGTWKIDCSDSFFMGSSIQLILNNTMLPVFSLTATGMGYGAIGSYSPYYHNLGKGLASQADKFFSDLKKGKAYNGKAQIVGNVYTFDANQIETRHLNKSLIPKNVVLVNKAPSFFRQYRNYIFIGILIAVLLIAIIVTVMVFLFKTNRLKSNLEKTVEELKAAKLEMENADAMKSAFLANMSHEIRTPLNAIVGFSRVLANPASTTEEKNESISIIESNNSLLLHLIDDILDLSRIESGNVQLNYSDVDIGNMLRKLGDTFSIKEKNPSVQVVQEHKWEDFGLVRSDEGRLTQVMDNLLSNAMRFTTKGVIRFGCTKENEMLCFYVSDTGCGIPLDKIDTIFDRYVKLDRFSQGTGLGLAISKSLVSKLGGRIWVDSEVGKGSTFRFTIPYVQSAGKAKVYDGVKKDNGGQVEENTGDEIQCKAVPNGGKRPLILIAEDNESNYILFETILRKDYDVIHAENGKEALEFFLKRNPDLIIMDIKMPVMDGYEAAAEIRKHSSTIPIIAATAFAFSEDEKHIRMSGFTDYISKPIRNRLFLEKIAANLASSRHGK
ncbi:MAG: ATP-binding protein [Bacteroidales bacterium]|nr:ATP-binding protein [Bacteroidales bacterium]MCI2121466.1 ATP-binding protein [Bacteroidales bacterium]MCI2145263.1 ATP-binding protein [Bacteroidales bacterium]